MSTQPPPEGGPPRQDVGPPGYVEPYGAPAAYRSPPPDSGSHAGPWILGAAVVLVLGAILAVLIHNATTEQTQTVITRSPTVNTTQVDRTGPTVTQNTTTATVTQKTQTVTQPPKTVTQPARTVTQTAPAGAGTPTTTTP
jgi:hypothetical protein